MNLHQARHCLMRRAREAELAPSRDIVLLGASAGGVEALRALIRDLPGDLPAAVFVVLHMPRDRESCLAAILDRVGPLTARFAQDGETIRHGRIYVAPPNRHLVVNPGYMRLEFGTGAERWRPCLDSLFRSAALSYGPRVTAAVLTGYQNDGAAGLACVKANGGATIVQDPQQAQVAQMPLNAMSAAQPDYSLPLAAIPPVLTWQADRMQRDRGDAHHRCRHPQPVRYTRENDQQRTGSLR